VASWGDIALAREWSAGSRRRASATDTTQVSLSRAAGLGSLSPWAAPGSARLTAQGSRAERLEGAADGGSAAIHRPSAPLHAEQVERRPLRVLIADDQPLFSELLLRICAAQDWIEVVGCAVNGRDAVVLAAAAAPDVVLMDLEMPLMDGVEATRRIRRQSATPVVVLALTGAPVENREQALVAGATSVIGKDVDPAEIVGRLEAVFLARAA
jgi:CheY-like chemotaxis protein